MKYIFSVKNNISYILFIEDCVIIIVTNHAEVIIMMIEKMRLLYV